MRIALGAAHLRRPVVASLLVAAVACRHDATAPDRATPIAARLSAERDDEAGAPPRVTTFEDFALGAIDGQHDWKSLGGLGAPPPVDPLDTHCAVYDHEIADVAAVVAGGGPVRSFGRKSLRISNAVTSGCYSDQTFSSRTADVAGETGAWSRSSDGTIDYALAGAELRSRFDAQWSFASTVPLAQQPGLDVVVSPARGDNQRMSWVQMSDLGDGLAVAFVERSNVAAPGDFIYRKVARGLDRRVPHTIRLTMDFVDGPSNDMVRVYVDGELRLTGTSWENYYRYDANGRSNFGGATPVVNRLMFRTGSDVHRGYPGLPAPATRGHGFLIDDIRLSVSGAQHEGARGR